jgi:hypothetical protein
MGNVVEGAAKGVGNMFVAVGEGIDTVGNNIPGVNIVYGAAKSAGAAAVGGVVAATGNDAHEFFDYGAHTMIQAVTHPVGDPVQLVTGLDKVATNVPFVATVWDTGKAAGATVGAGVVAATGGDPRELLEIARYGAIDGAISLAADVGTVATGGLAAGVARGAAAVARGVGRVALAGTARAVESVAARETGVAIRGAAAAIGQSATERAAAATARAEMRAAAAATAISVREAETVAAHQTVQAAAAATSARVTAEAAVAQEAVAAQVLRQSATQAGTRELASEAAKAEERALVAQTVAAQARATETAALKQIEEAAAKAAAATTAEKAALKGEQTALKAAAKAETKAAAAAEKAALTPAQKIWKIAKPTKADVVIGTVLGYGLDPLLNEEPDETPNLPQLTPATGPINTDARGYRPDEPDPHGSAHCCWARRYAGTTIYRGCRSNKLDAVCKCRRNTFVLPSTSRHQAKNSTIRL